MVNLFNPRLSIVYSFLAGILISVAVNLFTGAYLAEKLALPLAIVNSSALLLFLGSAGFLVIAWGLEEARRTVDRRMGDRASVSSGTESDYTEQEIEYRKKWLLPVFVFSVFLILCSMVLLSSRQWLFT